MSESLTETLIRHEGIQLRPYTDTVGKLTIGVGRNLDDLGITRDEALVLLANDIARARSELIRCYPWVEQLNPVRQDALVNMVFNLGLPAFSGFRKMLAALQDRNFEQAAKEMLDSRWATQVHGRASELADRIERGRV
ncbi:glycoside hydrolase family protein [Endozoicomonas lisbonensis]|uniref:Lysozyme n=1 Tax=Endozoicomonas lisbonensis TaxID=3120522 RepID=A0ABV2SAX4_9GAMM